MTNSTKPTKIRYQMTTSLTTEVCKICRHEHREDSPFYNHGFLMELCQQYNIYPVWRIPYYKAKLRALIKKHFKEYHPQYEVK